MKQDLGDEADSFLGSFLHEAKRGIRLNPEKYTGSADAILPESERVPWENNGYYYKGTTEFMPGRSPLHHAGAYYIQEPSAMAPVNFLDVRPGMCVLDLCAAPGGKSTQIAAFLKNKGLLITNEIVPDRAKILSQNIERLGIKNTLVTCHDPDFLSDRYPASFDRILVDAPCSGEGMFRRDPVAVKEWSVENVKRCVIRQEEILKAAAVMLKPGGRLVYSTCTFGKEENEEQIANFLKSHEDFHPVDIRPFTGMREGGMKGTLRIWPQDNCGEGHFMAVLLRNGELNEASYGYRGVTEPCISGKSLQGITVFRDFISEVIKDGDMKRRLSDNKNLFASGKNLCLIPEGGLPSLSRLRYLRAGIQLGEIKKDRFIPSHSLAMAISPGEVYICHELDPGGDEVKQYLAGESLDISNTRESHRKGWCLVSTGGISLGWGKISGGIMKNHYPKGLRSGR
ncbi:MAG: RsmF rRNA methyltransferase first C-terminal domain-containing protein [Lachnospiraceae bacterium]|nr:RsmF rRNA methyltransferase first C-terminal domain-containing protein [Lachnospiraceae bacterium]